MVHQQKLTILSTKYQKVFHVWLKAQLRIWVVSSVERIACKKKLVLTFT